MAKFLSSEIIRGATQRLIASRAKSGLVDFLVLKRALARAEANEIPFSSTDANFIGAMTDLASTYPNEIEHTAPDKFRPFVKVFGTADAEKYVTQKWETNGPADTLSGPKWNSVVKIVGSNPRRGSLKADYEQYIVSILLKAGSQLPALADAAIWYHRATNLDIVLGSIADSHQLSERLQESFVAKLGLTNEEIAALFDEDAEALDNQPLKDILRDTVADPQEYLPDLSGINGDLDNLLSAFEPLANGPDVGLRLSHELLLRFATALGSKSFLILSGLAGSGKTKLAQAFARWLTPDPGYVSPTDKTKGKNPNPFYKVVSVGADWSGNENILGYPNGLHPEEYLTKPALELILHAKKDEHKNDPHFLILDEMNLSHVERYFADILSAIESDEKIHLHRDEKRTAGAGDIEPEIGLPKNLFIIGTVNIDETTHMFSPKVLDRANVIEFRMKDTELASFLEKPVKPNLDQLDGKGKEFGQAFVDAAKNPADVPDSAKLHFQCEMLLFFKVLQKHGAEFGYRVAHEAGRFVHFYEKLGGETDVDEWFKDAFDCIIVQKFLPKLHGSESKLRGVLFSLAHLCADKRAWTGPTFEDNKGFIETFAAEAIEKGKNYLSSGNSPTQVLAEELSGKVENARYPLSFEKIERIWRAAQDNGFASFAES